MLKIKDSVDLKELEKFGFKPKYNEDTGKVYEYYRIIGDRKGTTIKYNDNFNGKYKYRNFWTIFTWNRQITNHGYIKLSDDDYEVLYDLIQARFSRKGVDMRIITKKEEQEIESIKKQNEFLSKGYRAMSIVLDYQRAIVSILKTLDIKEIEIDDKLLYTTDDEIRVHSTINHTTIIKLVEKE